MGPAGDNIVLTGLPRSGTTLTCHLLNKLPQSVALNEPMKPLALAGHKPDVVCDAVAGFFDLQRDMILNTKQAESQSWRGEVPSNNRGEFGASGERERLLDGTMMSVEKPLTSDFRLFIKQPAFFTAMLKHLALRNTCFAIIRNPLATLQSWATCGMPAQRGRSPVAEAFDSNLQNRLEGEVDVLGRQLLLLGWFFENFAQYVPQNTIKYEDIVDTHGRELARLDPSAQQLDEPLQSQNKNPLYAGVARERLAEEILKSDGAYWQFYTRGEVESLLDAAFPN